MFVSDQGYERARAAAVVRSRELRCLLAWWVWRTLFVFWPRVDEVLRTEAAKSQGGKRANGSLSLLPLHDAMCGCGLDPSLLGGQQTNNCRRLAKAFGLPLGSCRSSCMRAECTATLHEPLFISAKT